MDGFARRRFAIDGVETVVLSAGAGPPLVFLHGEDTTGGFAFARAWAERFELIVPFHPGFGESGDDPRSDDVQDYVLHYLDLFDRLGLARVRLVGFSLGARLAATFAAQHPHRVEKLVLVAPTGLPDPAHPMVDPLLAPPEPPPDAPDPELLTARYREATTLARLTWERPLDRKLARWLRRVGAPTLLV